MLHEKELVLNKDDTENFLAAVNIVRSLNDALNLRLAAYEFESALASGQFQMAREGLEQNIVINADFPNATDHNEIMEALETLADRAAQYARRTDRLIDEAIRSR